MLKRCITICLAAVLVAGMCLTAMLGARAAEEVSIYDLLDRFPMENISYRYLDFHTDPETVQTASVWFSPALLLQDARTFSGEMAKSSVALAMAAYDKYYVESLLKNMGFTVYDNSSVYERSDGGLTIDDCDYVAYTIAYRDILVSGERYRIYAVPIKGTTENAEWFSNFHMGGGTEHDGFRKASEEVYNALQGYFENTQNDIVDADHRIVWLTGHSRGAACANLIAGWLSDSEEEHTKAEHVFAYTFACPSVSTDADTTLTNIYNFNNPGDLIPTLPLEKWDFKRYGQTIMLDTSLEQLNNVRQQFSTITGSTYAAETSDGNYLTLLEQIFGTDREEFNNSATLQAIISLVAWFLGGKEDASIKDVLLEHFDDVPEIILENAVDLNIAEIVALLLGADEKTAELIGWLSDVYAEATNMSDEEFAEFAKQNADIIDEIELESGIEIYTASALLTARSMLQVINEDISTTVGCINAALNLVADNNGNVMDKVAHGHTQITYTAWINSLYYGYRGWLGSEDVKYLIGDESLLSIGDDCFFRCTSLEALTLNVPAIYLGDNAFGQCYGLRAVTIPVDYTQSGNPFAHTEGVTQISYTYGRTGVMTNRSTQEFDPDYKDTLEFASRNSIRRIDFAEGITHIGNYLFGGGSQSLEYVLLPTTLKTIGSYAFYECEALPDITFYGGIESLGSYAFSDCDSLAELPSFPDSLTTIGGGAFADCDGFTGITIPETVKRIGPYAFLGCDALEELTLPNTTLEMGLQAFGNCGNLRTVTLPVDYDFSQKPFSGSDGVETIHYTYGRTGILTDRSNDSSGADYYRKTLEYVSRDSIRTIDFAQGVIHIGNYLFGDGSSSLEQVSLPAALKTIGNHAFYNCTALTGADFHEVLEGLGDSAFYGCNAMTELTLPDTKLALGQYAFGNCKGLRTVTLPVDYDFSQSPFGGRNTNEYTDGVTTIHYTYGQNGTMTDRTNDSSQSDYYGKTLEYFSRNSIQTMDFEKGITNVADYLFYPGSSSLTTVKLPATLKTIGDYAFYYCAALQDTKLHAGIVSLGSFAFYNCDSLTNVTIPDTVTSIGDYAFYSCNGMAELTLPDTAVMLGKYAFGECKALRTVTLPVDYDFSQDPFGGSSVSVYTDGVTTIHYTCGQCGVMPDRTTSSGQAAYFRRSLESVSRSSIQTIDFEEGITHIGNYLFGSGSSSLTTVVLPSTLKTIGNSAFYSCTALADIKVHEGIVTLGSHAFYNCDSLTKVTIPASVTGIGDYAFQSCSTMAELILPDTTVTLGKYAFGECKALRTVTLPVDYDFSQNPFGGSYAAAYTDGVTTIHYTYGQSGTMTDRTNDGSSADYYSNTLEYASRDSIQSIDFEEGITNIADYLFYPGSSSLTTVKLPATLKTIGGYSFYNCTVLSDIKVHEGLVSLGSSAFYNCDGFIALPAFPDSLTTIGDSAFSECDSLTEVTIPDTVTGIGNHAFFGCGSMAELILPDTTVTLGKYAFGDCHALRMVTLPVDYDFSQNPFGGYYASAYTDGVTTIHYTYGQSGTMTDRTNDSSQSDYSGLTLEYFSRDSIQAIDFEEGITHIGNYLFSGGSRSLTTVVLPSTLKTIGNNAFCNCTALADIEVHEGIVTLGSHAFYNCDSLTKVTIPASVTGIGDYAFYSCSTMAELILPDTTVTLGKYAFGECKALRTVTLPVDYDFSQNPFGGYYASAYTDGVTTIHYTYGQNGTMTDRTNDSSQSDCGRTLEHLSRNSIQSIDFEEGITNIASYLFYPGSGSLKTVKLPSTVKTIGSYAFYRCTASAEITFCGSAPEIASDAFRNTTATCRYPGWDETWTADVMLDYGGTLTWAAYGCDPITLTGKSFTLSFEDEILVNFYYAVSDLTNVIEHGMLVFYEDPGTVDFAAADAVYSAPICDSANDRYMATTTGIAAKEMGNTRYYAAYAKLADGTCVYSNMYDYSPKKYAMNMLSKTSTSDKQKALCVAMLNYGAAAQSYFGYNADNLMNAALTAEQKALVIGYDKALFTGAVAADSNKIGAFATTASGFSKKFATVSFEGAFSINFYFTPSIAVSGNMTLYIWTPEDYAAVTTLTADNASGIVTMAAGSDGRYWGQARGIPAKALDDTYYVSGVYTDAEGNTHCTGVIAYSLSKYCMNNDSGNMGQLARATAMYGYYAKNYFA